MTHHYPPLRRGDDRPSPYPVPLDRDGEQACADHPLEKFFPEEGLSGGAHLTELRAICNSCPFQAPCLAYAMDRPSLYGVWGGLSKDERDAIRRNTRRAS